MSVWKTACYQDDAFQSVYRVCPRKSAVCPVLLDLLDLDIAPVTDFDLPVGVLPGNARKQAEDNPDFMEALVDRPPANRYNKPQAGIYKYISKLAGAHHGLAAVYRLLSRNWSRIFNPVKTLQEERDFIQSLYIYGSAASYRTQKDAVEKAKFADEQLLRFISGPHKAVRSLITVATAGTSRSNVNVNLLALSTDEELPELNVKDKGPWNNYEVRWYKGILFLTDTVADEVYILLAQDVERLEKVIMGFAWAGFYFNSYSDKEPAVTERIVLAFDQTVAYLRKVFAHTNSRKANFICRALDVCLYTFLAEKANDISTRALEEQQAKYAAEGLDKIINIHEILSPVSTLAYKEALEVLHLYKVLPQPDYDIYGAAQRQKDMYDKAADFGTACENDNTGSYEDLFKYQKHIMIQAFHKKHGVCPGAVREGVELEGWAMSYPHIHPKKIPFTQVDKIDLGGSYRYIAHGEDILNLVKDKSICPIDIAEIPSAIHLAKRPVSEKNMLMDCLARKDPIDLLELHKTKDQLFYDVKAEDKAEGKKPNGRWFFEAHTDVRLLQSEYELSVAEYAKNVTGVMAGKSLRDKIAAMNHVSQIPPEDVIGDTKTVYISFDIAKFSPSLDIDVHKRLDALWAEAFGVETIKDASDIFSKGKIHYVKRKIHHSFDKAGKDFEGFSGRKLTMYHCGVMGYTVRRLRELNIINVPGRFACLIDDGLLRLVVPSEDFDNRLKRIMQVIEDVYKMACMKISWDKTFVSRHYCVFLNEHRYDGAQASPGLRAFLRITNRSDVAAPSMLDDLAILESTCRGAISAGSSVHMVYAAYTYMIMDIFRKWSRGKVQYSGTLSLYTFAPVALGGFGVCGANALTGSLSTDPIVEGIGNLRAIAVRFRKLAPEINKIVNTPMREISPVDKLRNPTTVRAQRRTLKGSRARAIVEKYLEDFLQAPVVRSLVGDVRLRASQVSLDDLVRSGNPPAELLSAIWRSTVDYAIANLGAKFLRARTAMALVPRRAMFRVVAANMSESVALITSYGY